MVLAAHQSETRQVAFRRGLAANYLNRMARSIGTLAAMQYMSA